MPLSILGIFWSFMSSIYSIYIYITSIGSGTGTVLKVSIWHRYRNKTKRYPTVIITCNPYPQTNSPDCCLFHKIWTIWKSLQLGQHRSSINSIKTHFRVTPTRNEPKIPAYMILWCWFLLTYSTHSFLFSLTTCTIFLFILTEKLQKVNKGAWGEAKNSLDFYICVTRKCENAHLNVTRVLWVVSRKLRNTVKEYNHQS